MARAAAFDPGAAAQPGSGVFGLPHAPEQAGVVLVPVPFEATTSYGGGTAKGPRAILEASKQVDLFDVETGRPYEVGIAMLPEPARVRRWNADAKRHAAPVVRAGGATTLALRRHADRVNAIGAALNGHVRAEVDRWMAKGKLVGTIGGDHSVSFGAIEACAARHRGVGILHFDAHADLRLAYEGFAWSHASILRNVVDRIADVAKVVQVGIRDLCEEEMDVISGSKGRVVAWFASDLATRRFEGESWARLAEEMVADLPNDVYVSFDIDGLDPTLCPHTGTPVPGGLSFHEATAVLAALRRSGRRIVGFDLTEVTPGPRGDEWDANVGARLLYKLIGYAVMPLAKDAAIKTSPSLRPQPRR
ncbi:MAG TPA: agmatinase family protein [Planctomycetota bacterium]|nr:agmatinase family protein [Planctomycetota bacterium]